MGETAKQLIDKVLGGATPAEAITEITRVVGGRRKRVDPKKSREAKKAARKRSPAARRAAAKKGSKKKGSAGRAKAARKAKRTKRKFGSIGASFTPTRDGLIAEWKAVLEEVPPTETKIVEFVEAEIAALEAMHERLWETEGPAKIDTLTKLYEAAGDDDAAADDGADDPDDAAT